MRASTFLLAAAASLAAGPAQGQPAAPASTSFESIELRGGGLVTVRHGPTRRVTVVAGHPDRDIRTEEDRLIIDRCRANCAGGHRIEIEIVTPEISGLAVTDGGRIALVGDFPPQEAISAAVSDGGTIDMRQLDVSSVSAAVEQGGRILARPGRQISAAISDGGVVTYWGTPIVTSSVRRGGVVVRGAAQDLGAPLDRLDPQLAPLPALLPVPAPPAPPKPPRGPWERVRNPS